MAKQTEVERIEAMYAGAFAQPVGGLSPAAIVIKGAILPLLAKVPEFIPPSDDSYETAVRKLSPGAIELIEADDLRQAMRQFAAKHTSAKEYPPWSIGWLTNVLNQKLARKKAGEFTAERKQADANPVVKEIGRPAVEIDPLREDFDKLPRKERGEWIRACKAARNMPFVTPLEAARYWKETTGGV